MNLLIACGFLQRLHYGGVFPRPNNIDLIASLMGKSEDSTFCNKVSGSYVIAHLCRPIRCYLCNVIGRSMGLFNSELDFQILRIENYKIEHRKVNKFCSPKIRSNFSFIIFNNHIDSPLLLQFINFNMFFTLILL